MKKHLGVPVFLWIAAEVVLAAFIILSSSALPDTVATHFNGSGQANGWMSRKAYTIFFTCVSLIIPSCIVAAFAAARFGSPARLNVPNPSYWRSAEHYPTACQALLWAGMWMAIGVCAWLGAMQVLIVTANGNTPAHLPGAGFGTLTGCLLAYVAVWVGVIWRYFAKAGELNE